jgi:hypothetical protein
MYSVHVSSVPELTKNCNVVKEALLEALERDGLLKKPAAEIAQDYAVILAEPGWLGRLFRKVTGEKDGDLAVRILKSV